MPLASCPTTPLSGSDRRSSGVFKAAIQKGIDQTRPAAKAFPMKRSQQHSSASMAYKLRVGRRFLERRFARKLCGFHLSRQPTTSRSHLPFASCKGADVLQQHPEIGHPVP